jgi:hypothetical protein
VEAEEVSIQTDETNISGIQTNVSTIQTNISALQTQVNNIFPSFLDVRKYGAKCDGIIAFDAAVTAGSTAFTSAALQPFTGTKAVIIDGAGTGGDGFQTTLTCTTAGTGTLGAAPVTTVSAACAVWGTDDSTAWTNVLQAAYNAVSATIFSPGVSLALAANCLNPPNSGTTHTPYNGGVIPPNPAGTTWGPWQPAIRITGNGPYFDGQWGGQLLATGSIIVLPIATPSGTGKISTYGVGSFEMDHVTLFSLGNPNYPMVYTTNTTLNFHDMAVVGQPSKLRNTCNQDVFSLGGSTTVIGAGNNAPFQGYTSSFTNVYCDRVRQVFQTGLYANGILTRNVTVSSTCGSSLTNGAPFMLTGVGHQLGPDVVELPGYTYAYNLNGCSNSYIQAIPADPGTAGSGNQETTQGVVYLANSSKQNTVMSTYAVGQVITEDASSQGANKILAPKYTCSLAMSAPPAAYAQSTIYQVPFNSAVNDPFGLANLTYGAIQIPQTDWYDIKAEITWNTSMPTGYQIGWGIYADTTLNHATNANPTYQGCRALSGNLAGQVISFRAYLKGGVYVSIAAFQTNPTAQALLAANCYFQVSST